MIPFEKGGIAFLLNVGGIADPAELCLPPGIRIYRAGSELRLRIHSELQSLATSHSHVYHHFFWEYEDAAPNAASRHLPPEEWKYYVLEFEGDSRDGQTLASVLRICEPPLSVGFTFYRHPAIPNGGTMVDTAALFHALEHRLTGDPGYLQTLDQSFARLFSEYYTRFRSHDHSMLNLQPAFATLASLDAMPRDLPLRYLGLFSIVESLLAHQPKPTDPYDSITRQVTKKMALINNRLSLTLRYELFHQVSADSAWKKLYSYRSAIAHGAQPPFTSDVQALRSPDVAMAFLHHATRSLLRFALDNPQLLRDLKEC